VNLLAIALAIAYITTAALPATAPDWELVDGSPNGAARLWALADGQVAVMDDQHVLSRSDDDGLTWEQAPNPPDGRAVRLDPTDPTILYGSGSSGISRSANGGQTWRVILPSPDGKDLLAGDGSTAEFEISPTDHDVLYVFQASGSSGALRRSRDAGASWQTVSQFSAPAACTGYLHLLTPTATGVASDMGCQASRNMGETLRRSSDAGSSWSDFLPGGSGYDIAHLVGGSSIAPGRWYAAADGILGSRAARLLRTDDDGASWTPVFQADDPREWSLGGLAYDPTAPDTVWIALGYSLDPTHTGVRVSDDAGMTWTYLGRQDIGWVRDLVRSADGTMLLAATKEGIWRYPLS
jgi:photosystem II stability/assembly factor-like uncharacterized protein